MKKLILILVSIAGALALVHLLLGLNRRIAFALIDRNWVSVNGRIDRYLLGRCSDHRKSAKTTAGDLETGAYAVLDSHTNRIELSEGFWEGGPSSKEEDILLIDGKIENYTRRPIDGVVIMFTPQKIAFVDFTKRTSGYFMRERPGERGQKK